MWALPEKGDIEGFDWKDVQYELRRLEGDGFISGDHLKRITARGIEYMDDLGIETILENDLRERVLESLYEADREEGPYARANATGLAEELGESESTTGAVLHYLEDSGLIDVQGTLAHRFWRVKINPRGMAKHEAIQAAGGGWATSTTSPTDGHEFVFGPNEEAEAARLLRDVVEVARSQILIVDPYARAGIISKLGHVPRRQRDEAGEPGDEEVVLDQPPVERLLGECPLAHGVQEAGAGGLLPKIVSASGEAGVFEVMEHKKEGALPGFAWAS